MYGHVCSTGGQYVPFAGGDGCANPEIIQEASSYGDLWSDGLPGMNYSQYRLNINKNPPGGSVILRLTFTHPVPENYLEFTGNVSL